MLPFVSKGHVFEGDVCEYRRCLLLPGGIWSLAGLFSYALRKWKDEIRFPNRGHGSTSIACCSIS